jgi:hypothetical protein
MFVKTPRKGGAVLVGSELSIWARTRGKLTKDLVAGVPTLCNFSKPTNCEGRRRLSRSLRDTPLDVRKVVEDGNEYLGGGSSRRRAILATVHIKQKTRTPVEK